VEWQRLFSTFNEAHFEPEVVFWLMFRNSSKSKLKELSAYPSLITLNKTDIRVYFSVSNLVIKDSYEYFFLMQTHPNLLTGVDIAPFLLITELVEFYK